VPGGGFYGVFFVLPAMAAQLGKGDNFNLPIGQAIGDNLYAAGGSVTLSGVVEEDAAVAGGTVLITGDVREDLTVAGGNIIISGAVGDDLRSAGGSLVFTGRVSGEAMFAGGQVSLSRESFVGDDLFIGGGVVVLDGEVAGKTNIGGGEVSINGRLKGPVRIYADKIKIGSSAVLESGLIYDSPVEAQIENGARITGDPVFNKMEKHGKSAVPALIAGFWFLKLAMVLVLGLAGLLLFKKPVRNAVEAGLKEFWANLLKGFVLIIMIPVASIILFITVLGIPFAVILLLFMALAAIFASALSGIVFGAWVYKILMKKSDYVIDWKIALFGIVLFSVVCVIPVLGWIVCLVFFLAAFGSIFNFSYRRLKNSL
jgi:hypothetical protein